MKTLNDLLTHLYLVALGVAALPILIGLILRKIAGKHAAPYYELETDEEAEIRRKKRKRLHNEYLNLQALDIVD